MTSNKKNDKKSLPSFLQPTLWSFKVKDLDLKRDKRYIITQILNYGNKRDVSWLLSHYSDKDIKKVLRKPGRGSWLPQVLNFWTTIYNIKLDKKTFEEAIFEPSQIKEKYLKKFKRKQKPLTEDEIDGSHLN